MRANSHPEHAEIERYTKRQRMDTAIHTLVGLLHGISIDDNLNADEIAEVLNWCKQYNDLKAREPFKEIIAKLDEIMADGIITPDEQDDLLWVCKNLSPDGIFYDEITNEIQRLHGILHGVLADSHISTEESKNLQSWLYENDHLKGSYPYDELDSLLLTVLEDGKIDKEEEVMLREFFEDFITHAALNQQPRPRHAGLPGCRKYTRNHAVHSAVYIGIVKHHDRGFATKFQRQHSKILSRIPNHVLGSNRPTRERDTRHIWV